ncbi:MAG: hypothetical protein CSB15_00920 [Clostridiales bacterium]|nr:MAG: hypothetical protein CSB15_00920 [Clostridiales bacterium]
MKKKRIILILILVFVIFNIFYIPKNTVEYKVKEISSLFNSDKAIDFKTVFINEFNKFKVEERKEIFARLPFNTIKKHKLIFISNLDLVIKNWRSIDEFNFNYLKTEEYIKKEINTKASKKLKKVERKVVIKGISEFLKAVDELSKQIEGIESSNFFLIPKGNSLVYEVKKEKYILSSAKLNVLDIYSRYIMIISYENGFLKIQPTDKKVEDKGFYELEEVLSKFNIKEIVKFANYKVKNVDIDIEEDSLLGKKETDKKDNKKSKKYFVKTISEESLKQNNKNDDKKNESTNKFKGNMKISIVDDVKVRANEFYNIVMRKDDYYLLDAKKSKDDYFYFASLLINKGNPSKINKENSVDACFNVFIDN